MTDPSTAEFTYRRYRKFSSVLRDLEEANSRQQSPPVDQVESLIISSNELELIPIEQLLVFSSLLQLDISNNFLLSLPDLSETSLVTLNASNNLLNEICPLPNSLLNLDVSGCRLDRVSASLSELPGLTGLNMAFNQISTFEGTARPGWISLRELSLAGNRISTTHELPYFPVLQILDLSHNAMDSYKDLSAWLASRVPALTSLSCMGLVRPNFSLIPQGEARVIAKEEVEKTFTDNPPSALEIRQLLCCFSQLRIFNGIEIYTDSNAVEETAGGPSSHVLPWARFREQLASQRSESESQLRFVEIVKARLLVRRAEWELQALKLSRIARMGITSEPRFIRDSNSQAGDIPETVADSEYILNLSRLRLLSYSDVKAWSREKALAEPVSTESIVN